MKRHLVQVYACILALGALGPLGAAPPQRFEPFGNHLSLPSEPGSAKRARTSHLRLSLASQGVLNPRLLAAPIGSDGLSVFQAAHQPSYFNISNDPSAPLIGSAAEIVSSAPFSRPSTVGFDGQWVFSELSSSSAALEIHAGDASAGYTLIRNDIIPGPGATTVVTGRFRSGLAASCENVSLPEPPRDFAVPCQGGIHFVTHTWVCDAVPMLTAQSATVATSVSEGNALAVGVFDVDSAPGPWGRHGLLLVHPSGNISAVYLDAGGVTAFTMQLANPQRAAAGTTELGRGLAVVSSIQGGSVPELIYIKARAQFGELPKVSEWIQTREGTPTLGRLYELTGGLLRLGDLNQDGNPEVLLAHIPDGKNVRLSVAFDT